MVCRVGDKNVSTAVYCNSLRKLKLSFGGAFSSPFRDESAGRIELLDSIVLRIGDKDIAGNVRGDARGVLELRITRTFGSSFRYEGAVGEELLDAVISRVDDIDISFAVECCIPRFRELPGGIARASPCNTKVDFWSGSRVNQRFYVYPDAAVVLIHGVAHLQERG